jgi:hypothetical protein
MVYGRAKIYQDIAEMLGGGPFKIHTKIDLKQKEFKNYINYLCHC